MCPSCLAHWLSYPRWQFFVVVGPIFCRKLITAPLVFRPSYLELLPRVAYPPTSAHAAIYSPVNSQDFPYALLVRPQSPGPEDCGIGVDKGRRSHLNARRRRRSAIACEARYGTMRLWSTRNSCTSERSCQIGLAAYLMMNTAATKYRLEISMHFENLMFIIKK